MNDEDVSSAVVLLDNWNLQIYSEIELKLWLFIVTPKYNVSFFQALFAPQIQVLLLYSWTIHNTVDHNQAFSFGEKRFWGLFASCLLHILHPMNQDLDHLDTTVKLQRIFKSLCLEPVKKSFVCFFITMNKQGLDLVIKLKLEFRKPPTIIHIYVCIEIFVMC